MFQRNNNVSYSHNNDHNNIDEDNYNHNHDDSTNNKNENENDFFKCNKDHSSMKRRRRRKSSFSFHLLSISLLATYLICIIFFSSSSSSHANVIFVEAYHQPNTRSATRRTTAAITTTKWRQSNASSRTTTSTGATGSTGTAFTTTATATVLAFTTTRRRKGLHSTTTLSNHKHNHDNHANDHEHEPQNEYEHEHEHNSSTTNKNKQKLQKTQQKQSKSKKVSLSSNLSLHPNAKVTVKVKKNKVSLFEQRWDSKYNTLKKFKAIHGHCNVPQYYDSNPALGRWVRTQRVEHAHLLRPYLYNYDTFTNCYQSNNSGSSGNSSGSNSGSNSGNMNHVKLEELLNALPKTSARRIRKLNEIGFVWDVKEETWYKRVQDLIEFKKVYGHLRVPQRWSDDGDSDSDSNSDDNCNGNGNDNKRWKRLGLWVRNQRAQYKSLRNGSKKNHFLTEERIRILEDIGFCWDVQESVWYERFESLQAFKEYHGHADVPCVYEKDPTLARWVMQARYVYKEMQKRQGIHSNNNNDGSKKKVEMSNNVYLTKLTPERIKLLNDIGFVWDKNEAYWWEQYRALVEYKKKNGHCSVPSAHEDVQLRNWVMNMRRLFREYERKRLGQRKIVSDDDGGDGSTIINVAGLNKERIQALREIDFIDVKTIRPRRKKRVIRDIPVPVKRTKVLEKKKFIPFPWDDF
jgi:hypothetical protein